MDKVYGSTRPVWASDISPDGGVLSGRGIKDLAALVISVVLSELAAYLIRALTDKLPTVLSLGIFGLFSSLLCATFVVIAYLYVKNRQTRGYPATFAYCLRNPNDSTKAQFPFLLGCFLLKCELNGEFVATGESYLATQSSLDTVAHSNWESLHIGAAMFHGESRCFIVYAPHDELVPSGVFSFSLYEAEGGVVDRGRGSNFRGTLHFVSGNKGTPEPVVYAERFECDPKPDERGATLRGKCQDIIRAYEAFEKKVK